MSRCTMKLCKNFGRELLPEEIEFSPQLQINVCSECYSPLEEDMDANVPILNNMPPQNSFPLKPEKSTVATTGLPETLQEDPVLPLPEQDNQSSVRPTEAAREDSLLLKAEKIIDVPDVVMGTHQEQNVTVEQKEAIEDIKLGWENSLNPIEDTPQSIPAEGDQADSFLDKASPAQKPIDDGTFQDAFSLVGESYEFPILEVWQGGQVRGTYEIKKDIFVIGRSSRKNPDLPDLDFSKYADGNTVSRLHARILQYGGKYYIEDLHSSSYTWWNDDLLEPNQPHVLNHNDSITIGDAAELVFKMPGDSS